MINIKLDSASIETIKKMSKSNIENSINKSLNEFGKQATTWIANDMYKQKTGKIYIARKGDRTKTVVASRGGVSSGNIESDWRTGETPANVWGALRRSLKYNMSGNLRMKIGAGNGEAKYARALEEGSATVKPRWYLLKGVKYNETKFVARLLDEIKKALI